MISIAWLCLLGLAGLSWATRAVEYSCLSCNASCETEDPDQCDCETSRRCRGRFCFTELEIFPDEGLSGIVKGCTNDDVGELGCSFLSSRDNIRCRCEGDECSSRGVRESILPLPSRQTQCCHCPRKERCDPEECRAKCEGDYCTFHLGEESQTCGAGYSRLIPYLRGQWSQGQLFCAYVESDAREPLMHGCICQGEDCNNSYDVHEEEITQRLNETLNPATDKHYCYTLDETSSTPFTESVYSKSGSCEGNFCFVRYTEREVVVETVDYVDEEGKREDGRQSVILEPSYRLLAGCIDISDTDVPQSGCSADWDEDESRPHLVHCVCDSHNCNYWNQLFPDSASKYLSSDPRFRGTSRHSPQHTARQDTTTFLGTASATPLPPTLSHLLLCLTLLSGFLPILYRGFCT